MHRSRTLLALAFLSLASLAPLRSGQEATSGAAAWPPSQLGSIAGLNGFVENRGQWDDDVLFFARLRGVELTVTREALVFRPTPEPRMPEGWWEHERLRRGPLDEPVPAPSARDAEHEPPPPLVLRLPGDPRCVTTEGLDPGPTKHHFLVGDRRATGALGYQRVALRDVLPGIDVVLRADGGAFAYDLELEPHARLEDLVLAVEGAHGLELRATGTLVLLTDAGEVEQRIGASWQGETREPVQARFRALPALGSSPRFGFEAPAWDRAQALVVDPTLTYLTYVGGPSQEILVEAEVDASGAVHLLARSYGSSPITPGSFQATSVGVDAWIGKLSPDGSTLEWGTFLGGALTEDASDFAVAPDGSVVVVGATWSEDFPSTRGVYKETFDGFGGTKSDLFVTRLAPAGDALVWSTFYGGATSEVGWACALYPNGDVLAAFRPLSADPPATAGALDPVYDPGDQTLFRLKADGTQRIWQTYFRANTVDDLLIDETSAAYLVGSIQAQTAPLMTTPGAYKEVVTPGDGDGYVTKLDSQGSHLIWSTYLGGEPGIGSSGNDRVYAVALDAAKAVYVTGSTDSETFPTTWNAFQSSIPGGTEGFATKLLPDGSGLAWSTYLAASGFAGSTSMRDIGVDAAGNAVVFGAANEPFFPVTPDAFQPVFIGPLPSSSDTILCKLDAVGESAVYATWLGGGGSDTSPELSVGSDGCAYAAFQAGSSLSTSAGAYQPQYGGNRDLAVAHFELGLLPWRVLPGGAAGAGAAMLSGLGPLTPGSATRLALRGAPTTSPVGFVAGLQQVDLPFLGGTLVPYPSVVVTAITNALGEADLWFPWPSSPEGTAVFFQTWAPDPQAPSGWSASHGLMALP